MATRTVEDCGKEGKGAARLEALRLEAEAGVAAYVAGLLAAGAEAAGGAPAALLDKRIREALLDMGRRGLERALEADCSDCGAANAPVCGECGGRTRYVGRELSRTETALGPVRLAMGRYACVDCGRSVRPRAARLDIEGSMMPMARRMASELGSSCCYAEANRLLEVVGGVNFGAKRVERATRSVGEDVESRRTELLSSSISVVGGEGSAAGGGGASNDPTYDGSPARKSLKEGQVLCVALDGTGVPARPSETAERSGRDGGRATTREAKVGAVWLFEPDGEGGKRTVPDTVRYFAAIESAEDDKEGDSPVARRLLRELAALGYAPEDVGVAIGDGAGWLRRLFAEWFPNAARIVDFFHAAEYLWEAARGRHPDDGEAAKRWAEKQCRRLKAGRMDAVLEALRAPGAGAGERAKATRYLSERSGQMRYDEYLAHGLPIGSGRAEAACKTVVGRRLKCTGMLWTVDGANPVLWVRCACLSGWFDDYWDDRLKRAA